MRLRPKLIATRARASLRSCRLCACRCGVDRTRARDGACAADAAPRVFYEGVEWAGESELVPTYVISLSGCNLRCTFCLTGRSSQDARTGRPLDADAIANRIAAAPRLRSVTILGGEPTVIRRLKEIGLQLKNSYKTVILVSPVLYLPQELEKEVTVVDFPLPETRDFAALLDRIVKEVAEQPKIGSSGSCVVFPSPSRIGA